MNRKIVLIVSLLLGLAAAFMTRAYVYSKEASLQREKAKLQKQYGQREALVFAREVYAGKTLEMKDLAFGTTYAMNNEDVLSTNDLQSVLGRAVTGDTIFKKGTPVRKAYLEGNDALLSRGLSKNIPAGYRAMSINVTGATSVSGLVKPNDDVDVIATFDYPEVAQTVDGSKKFIMKKGDPVTYTILQKVKVLATGREDSSSRALGLYGAQASSSGGYSLVTLAVTPREAEILTFAEQNKGRLMLTLRQKNDLETVTDLPEVNYEKIREELSELNNRRNNPANR